MNVVFLLLTTAVSAGADPAPVQQAPAAKPVQAAPAATIAASSDCGCGCGCASDCCERPSFFERFRGFFAKRECCDSCATTCCTPAPAPCCKPAPCCAPVSCCDSCCEKPSLLDRLRARFSRHDCCETSCCDSCGAASTTSPTIQLTPAAPAAGERLKMPKGVDGAPGKQTIAPAAPTLTPAGATVEADGKNPF